MKNNLISQKSWYRLAGMLAAFALASMCGEVLAALPAPPLPTNMGTTSSDNWLEIIKQYAKDGGTTLGLIFSMAGFIWIAWFCISELNEVRSGKKEMGAALLMAIVGALVFLWVSYLLMRSDQVI